jgi:hypothetical protein
MRTLSKIPAALSLLLLAAHFLHAGQMEIAIVCLLLPIALPFRRLWVMRVMQTLLLTSALVWLWTMVGLANEYQVMGRPASRMMVILSCVAGFSAVSAMLLQFTVRRVRSGNE